MSLSVLMMETVRAEITCYTCDNSATGECNLTSHMSEYCEESDWCVKVWRASESSGEMEGKKYVELVVNIAATV